MMGRTQPEKTSRNHWRGRITLLLLISIPLTLMGLAWVIYVTGVGIPTATSNKGVLVQPPLKLDLPIDKWTLLILDNGTCDDDCRERLYITRQAQIALGREADRIQRWYVHRHPISNEALRPFFAEHHPRMVVVLGNVAMSPSAFYLVDPQGFLMMAYPKPSEKNAPPRGQSVLSDLKFVLKYSQ